jgi:alkylhydroperoxidase family enzyme
MLCSYRNNKHKDSDIMPRLRQVSRAEADPLATLLYDMLFGERDPVKEPGTETGTPGNWWTVFALVPDCLKHAVEGFQLYRDPARKLDPQLRELGQTRAGYTRSSQFVFSQHCKSCRSVGLSEEKIQAIPHWSVSDNFSELERAVGDTVRKAGLRHFRDPVVHSVGLEHTDDPKPFGVQPQTKPDQVLQPNMVVNVDMPHTEIGWGSVHMEDTVRITTYGFERLSETDLSIRIAGAGS